MSEMVLNIISGIAYLILAPVIGGLLAGLDRKISARMQRRVGPPVLQPFYDFFKLWDKQPIAVNEAQRFYVFGFLLFVIISGLFFFTHGDILLVVFTLTMASVCLPAYVLSWLLILRTLRTARSGRKGNWSRRWRTSPCCY